MERDEYWVICPYCLHEHGDAVEWSNSGTPKEVECDACGEMFHVWLEVEYVTAKIENEEVS